MNFNAGTLSGTYLIDPAGLGNALSDYVDALRDAATMLASGGNASWPRSP